MFIDAFCANLNFGQATASDATSFASRIPTVTEPVASSTRSVIEWGKKEGGNCLPACEILIIGTGVNDAVITGVRVIKWKRKRGTPGTSGLADLWIPIILCEFAAVLGNVTGAAGSVVPTTYFFADTITLVTGNANISNEIISPTGDVIAHATFDTKGAEKLEFTYDLGANATGVNVLWAPVS